MSVRGGKAVLQQVRTSIFVIVNESVLLIIAQVPSLFPQGFHLPVFNPDLCYAPTDAQSSQLEEGMVVTVEPGM